MSPATIAARAVAVAPLSIETAEWHLVMYVDATLASLRGAL
jgi:hypothetical protein